jgi:hypothetical protein
MKAEIFYHDFQDTHCLMFGTVADPKHYGKVAEVEVSDDIAQPSVSSEHICGLLFEQFNIGDRGVRSMSVGDKIRLEGRGTWVCQPVGWGLVHA